MPEENRIKVAIIGKDVYLKPIGFAMQSNSLGIPDFLNAMFRAGCTTVTFDLADCKGMDSTFLGVVADAATPQRRGKNVIVVNAGPKSVRQLRQIGLLPLVQLVSEEVSPPADLVLRQIDFVHFPKSEQQRLEKIKDLHQRLAELNDKNQKTFGAFIDMLEEELREQRGEQGAGG